MRSHLVPRLLLLPLLLVCTRYAPSSASVSTVEDDDEVLAGLEVWLLLHEASTEKISLQSTHSCPGGVGSSTAACVIALQPSRPGEVVLSIPRSLLLTAELGRRVSPTSLALLSSSSENRRMSFYEKEMGVIFLQVLLAEGVSSSATNLNLLPQDHHLPSYFHLFQSLLKLFPRHLYPLFWEPSQISLLKGSYLLDLIEIQKKTIEYEYQLVCMDHPPFADVCSLDMYQLLWVFVRANAYTLPASTSTHHDHYASSTHTVALVHVMELIEQRHYPQISGSAVDVMFDSGKDAFVAKARGDVLTGVGIYRPFDKVGNHKLLLTFGTCDEHQTFFWDTLLLEHERDAFFLAILRFLLLRLDMTESFVAPWELILLYGSVLHDIDFIYLNKLACPFESLESIWTDLSVAPKSLENEESILKTIEHICLSYLLGYDSSHEASADLTNEVPENQSIEFCAAQVIRAEQRPLFHFLEFARIGQRFLRSTSTLFPRLRSSARVDTLMSMYFERVLIPIVNLRHEGLDDKFDKITTSRSGTAVLTLTPDEFHQDYEVCEKEWQGCDEVYVEITIGDQNSHIP